jgi:putative ABC transport system substrate-binding protein
MQDAAAAMGLQFRALSARSDREIDLAFAAITQQQVDVLLVGSGPFLSSRRAELAALAARHRVPAIYTFRFFVTAGGLVSYGSVQSESYRQNGSYVGRILNGEKPADLPVSQPTKFELVINLKTAKALGLQFPDKLLALADEVVE